MPLPNLSKRLGTIKSLPTGYAVFKSRKRRENFAWVLLGERKTGKICIRGMSLNLRKKKREGFSHLGCSCARVNTETVVHKKQRQATFRDQCVEASSMLKRTPPIGAPKAACVHLRVSNCCYQSWGLLWDALICHQNPAEGLYVTKCKKNTLICYYNPRIHSTPWVLMFTINHCSRPPQYLLHNVLVNT